MRGGAGASLVTDLGKSQQRLEDLCEGLESPKVMKAVFQDSQGLESRILGHKGVRRLDFWYFNS